MAQLALTSDKRNWTVTLNATVEGGLILAMLICAIIVISQAGVRIWIKTRPVARGFAVEK